METHSLVEKKTNKQPKYLSLQIHGSFNATNNAVLLWSFLIIYWIYLGYVYWQGSLLPALDKDCFCKEVSEDLVANERVQSRFPSSFFEQMGKKEEVFTAFSR